MLQKPMGVASIDWLTLTTPETFSYDLNHENSRLICIQMWQVATGGEIVEPTTKSIMQYKGWEYEKVFAGQSDQGSMLQIKSWAADRLIGESGHSDNCTRIDLAVTFQMQGMGYNPNCLGKVMYEHMYSVGRRDAEYWVAPRLKLDEVKGDVLEIGARSSERYIRVYNKTLEGKDDRYADGEWWRAEVELKGNLARKAHADLLDHKQRGRYITGVVANELYRRGSLVPFSTEGALASTLSRAATNTTNESRVKWLKEQVAPTVQKLLAAGYWSHEIADWLGLQVD